MDFYSNLIQHFFHWIKLIPLIELKIVTPKVTYLNVFSFNSQAPMNCSEISQVTFTTEDKTLKEENRELVLRRGTEDWNGRSMDLDLGSMNLHISLSQALDIKIPKVKCHAHTTLQKI